MISLEMNSILLNRYIFQMFRQRKVKKFYKKIFFKMNFSLITYQAKNHLKKIFYKKKPYLKNYKKKNLVLVFFFM
ncbi:hypothetical protein CPARA_2gp187 (nucleomorph) [Cryptomonas paramecium]|uniref:Uncharacterized protein n=1 Tax=Cryptomonas paramaecium TaxID=2898 RepID=F2HHP9_9CRYP|nr:hypothetical protein CPARA_2gp187 [Cryptomonas paramecium]AEA38845.1 hypothetical protein CPARA_2gp187 [Cryptomonas paramecium]